MNTLNVLYKNGSFFYYTKIREIVKKITQPPINEICECSKNIVLISPNQINKKIKEEKKIENKLPIIITPKKRKKTRKTRRLHNRNKTNPNLKEELMNINREETEKDDIFINSNINRNYSEDDIKGNVIQKESKINLNYHNNSDIKKIIYIKKI